ncbi:uncharacterized protein LOC62_05G007253 [Vanrija pseudolonga]|uniref:Uncharacterized protein n=1 Tax=Vanrija pseudolonga TaxID=143232 RepID=A0AAF0YD32_9TREE|nr:hypothetical protein LOC62_05G007253 [Vanrija pseudolonga]
MRRHTMLAALLLVVAVSLADAQLSPTTTTATSATATSIPTGQVLTVTRGYEHSFNPGWQELERRELARVKALQKRVGAMRAATLVVGPAMLILVVPVCCVTLWVFIKPQARRPTPHKPKPKPKPEAVEMAPRSPSPAKAQPVIGPTATEPYAYPTGTGTGSKASAATLAAAAIPLLAKSAAASTYVSTTTVALWLDDAAYYDNKYKYDRLIAEEDFRPWMIALVAIMGVSVLIVAGFALVRVPRLAVGS